MAEHAFCDKEYYKQGNLKAIEVEAGTCKTSVHFDNTTMFITYSKNILIHLYKHYTIGKAVNKSS